MNIESKEQPLISLVIPVYNVEKYLCECLDSIMNQTLRNIEIICVNDASLDNSLSILQEYSNNDKRIKIINKEINEGSLLARKSGVVVARGNYITFIDSDDFYSSKYSLETMYKNIVDNNVDILMFDMTTVGAKKNNIKNQVENFVKVYEEELFGRESIISDCVNRKYGWNLCNKIFRADVCKKGFENVKDVYLISAEDCYCYLLICYWADTFKGVKCGPLYTYRCGSGISTGREITLNQFKHFCNEIDICEYLIDFFGKYSDSLLIGLMYELRKRFISHVVWRFGQLASEDTSGAYGYLLEKFQGAIFYELISEFYFVYRNRQNKLLHIDKNIFSKKCNKVKTIGIFYHRYYHGGVERVISLHIPMFLKMGYKVVLITEEDENKDDYYLPADVARVKISKDVGEGRYKQLFSIIEDYEIDTIVYHAAANPLILFDILMIKSIGVYFLLVSHGTFSYQMVYGDTKFFTFPKIYALSDKMIVLTEMDEFYYKNVGINVEYIPNPMQFDLSETERQNGKVILWVGRLDAVQKNYMDPLKIMETIIKKHSDACLIMLGSEYSKDSGKELLTYIDKHDLGKNVSWCGNVSDVKKWYENSHVFLMTSTFEAFPMVLAECQSSGLPIVMYKLPYLEMTKDGKGVISVEQNDISAAAQSIISIFEDNNFYSSLSAGAKYSFAKFKTFDQLKTWSKVLHELPLKYNETFQVNQNFELLIDTILFHYKKCVQNKNSNFRRRIKDVAKFNIGRYLRYKIISKITFGDTRKKYKDLYEIQKKLYRKIKNKGI